MEILLLVLLPWLGCWLPPVFARWGPGPAALAAGLPAALSLGILAWLTPAALAGEIVTFHLPWVPALGWAFSFRLDGLGLLFAWLILGIGVGVITYARFYLGKEEPAGRFYAFLLLFMGAMLGVVLTNDAIVLALFWECTSLSSFLLIGFWKHLPEARQGARMALTVTGLGGLALLGGLLMIAHITGTTQLDAMVAQRDVLIAHPLFLPALLLTLLGAFTKSAQFPFHFWLPRAMAAPTPVSAYLHSATMVKAGVFLLARLSPLLGGTEAWQWIVTWTGMITLVVGAWLANQSQDLKGLLAYSTISHLGLITALLGFSTQAAAIAAVLHILNHAAFKAALFMNAGIVDHEAGTRDIRLLGGLRALMPISAVLALVAAASMAGVPPLGGFLSKELFLEETLHLPWMHDLPWLLPAVAGFGATLSVAYSLRYVLDVYGGRKPETFPQPPHDPSVGMWLPGGVLVLLCIGFGLAPGLLAKPLVKVAALSVWGAELAPFKLKLWHGINPALGISMAALVLGTVVWTQRRRWIALHEGPLPLPDARRIFDRLIDGLLGGARAVVRPLERGGVPLSLSLLLATLLLVVGGPLVTGGIGPHPEAMGDVDGVLVTGFAMMVLGVLGTVVLHRQRILAVIFLSVVGLAVSLMFTKYSAPDLALTQLSVEVVTIILLLLALHLLPATTPRESGVGRRVRDLTLAVGVGGLSSALAWMLLARPVPQSIAAYHLAQSKPMGGGTNVVNVILVDFRGFDTFGEVTVLGIAALGIYALIDGLGIPTLWRSEDVDDESTHPVMLVVGARLLLPMALMVAIYLFLRGHNQPGGGFVAGLVVSVAIVLQYLASGIGWTQQRMRLDFHPVIASGILVAGLTGVGAWLFGRPFLTSWYDYFEWPVLGEFELASAMLFDTGVFLTVVGAVLLILVNLAKMPNATSVVKQREGDTETGEA
jgi:multicomponent K+:H+ antiporter subunit A